MLRTNPQSATAKVASILLFALAVMFTCSAQAQTFTVLHNFTGGADGGNPYAGLAIDSAGSLYGTTNTGGSNGYGAGTVFKMTHRNGNWTFAPLYSFMYGDDGGNPFAGVVFGPNGSLYGTTNDGGVHGDGTVFSLRPPPHACSSVLCSWTETVLYSFQGGTDGAGPYDGVVFDRAGNIYGTTYSGGTYGGGTVFELSPSDGGWTEGVIYAFSGSDGAQPISGVTVDDAGNLYGTTQLGGDYVCDGNGPACGTAFELTYSAGSGWAESFLYSFTGGADGADPYAGLIFDPSGNLYGATPGPYGAGVAGTVFKLTPSAGAWTFSLVYGFGEGGDECGPRGTLAMDGAGNLYGTTYCLGTHFVGSVFKLTHINGSWSSTTLYSFTGRSDGGYPEAGVTLDASGNVYGTTTVGGQYNYGVVFEITP
jgi:hypothetical protein